MLAPDIRPVATAHDKAEILALIDSRRPAHCHGFARSPAEIESRNLTISLGRDFAFAESLVCMSGTKPGVDEREQFCMQESMWLERKTEGWRIVRERTSAPLSVGSVSTKDWTSGGKLRVDWAHHDAQRVSAN